MPNPYEIHTLTGYCRCQLDSSQQAGYFVMQQGRGSSEAKPPHHRCPAGSDGERSRAESAEMTWLSMVAAVDTTQRIQRYLCT